MVTTEDKLVDPGKNTLAILVSSDKHWEHVVNLTAAACFKNKQVRLVFTGRGVLLTLRPGFEKLNDMAVVCICEASFRAHGLQGRMQELPGVTAENVVTQAENANLLAGAHRHLIF